MAETEIQFQVSAFLGALLAGSQSRPTCPPEPPTIGGVTLRIQQIELGPNALRHEGQRTQIAQEISIHVATDEDVFAHPDEAPAMELRIPTCALIAVEYRPKGTACEIGFDFHGIEPRELPALPAGVDPHQVEELLKREVARAFPSVRETIDFSALLPDDTAISKAGVSVSADGRIIAFRAELGPATGASGPAWTNFFNGFFSDHLAGANWGMFLPREMLVEMFVGAIRRSTASVSSPELTFGAIVGHYSTPGGKVHIELEIHAKIHPPNPLETIHVQTNVSVDLAMVEPAFLTVDVSLPDIEVVLDAVRGAIQGVIWSILGPAGSGFEALVGSALSHVKLPEDLGNLSDCQMIGPLHQRCRMRLPNAMLGETALRLTSFAPGPDGALLGGRLRITPLTPSELETSTRKWKWELPETSCGSDGGENTPRVRAEVSLSASGTTPARICGVEVHTKELSEASHIAVEVDDYNLPTTIALEIPSLSKGKVAHPARLLVATTLGVRPFELGSVPGLDQTEENGLMAQTLKKINRCVILQTPGFDLEWLGYPPWIDRASHHHWEIITEGLQLGDTLKIFDSTGVQLMHVNVLPGIASTLSAMVAPAEGRELTFTRLRNGDVAPGVPGMGMEIRQQELLLGAEIPLAGVCSQVLASELWSEQGAVAVLDRGLVAFELSNPRLPRRLGSWQVPGLRGALEWPGGLLAVSTQGFFNLDREGQLSRIGPDQEPSRVLDAALGGEAVHVLTEEELQVRSPQLETVSSQPSDRGLCLLGIGERLIVGGSYGIAVYRPGEGGELGEAEHSWPDYRVVGLEDAGLAAEGQVLAHLDDGSAWLLAFGEDDRVVEVAEFLERPWFAGGVRLERALVLLGEESRSLQISIPGKARLVGAEAALVP
ncbi:MAG TPA: hypothetical protein VFI03_10960 [Solirubrobacterales bacterium]|nr:hypothetical protein [Solirubrobacterales bacterium]